ncbi:ferredoxin, partial [Streptomyces sp. T-3]|nr:ferredoxin [Streptomyces sp. T-3]
LLAGGGPAALEALREVTRAVNGRGACKHPDGTARFIDSTLSAFTDDLAAHVLSGGCGRETSGVLPLPAAGQQSLGLPSGEKLAVDWTLCQGHGLCADIVPELIRLGPDGFPSVADAAVPLPLRGRAQRAVRRCPALALRLERAPGETPIRPALLSAPGRKALDGGRS